jgi:hypothetical protein
MVDKIPSFQEVDLKLNIGKEDNKDSISILDYTRELKKILCENVKSLDSKVICVECNATVAATGIDDIKRQIFVNKAKCRLGILGALLE